MGWGIWKPVDEVTNNPPNDKYTEGDKGKAADEVNMKNRFGKLSNLSGNLSGNKEQDAKQAKGILADIDRIVERGRARRGQ